MIRKFSIILFIFCCTQVSSTPLPVAAFANLPQVEQVKLSPNGNKVAFIRTVKGITYIGATNLTQQKTKYVLKTDNQEFKIGWHRWANNSVLLIAANYPVKRYGSKYKVTRLLKVNVDANESAQPVLLPKVKEHTPQFQTNVIDILPDEPNHFLLSIDLQQQNKPDVYKINLQSKKNRTLIYSNKKDIYHWMTDRQHRVRLGFGRDETKKFFRLRDLETNEWRNIWEYEIFDAPDIQPLGFGLNPNELYIRADHQGRYAIFKVDLTKQDLPRTLIYADEKYDVEGQLIYSTRSNDVIGVFHSGAPNGKVFFEQRYQKFQQTLNKLLPDAFNNIVSMSEDEQRYILLTSAKDSPGAYFIGDKKAGTLDFIIDRYPMLAGQALAKKHKVSYQARDKVAIEGFITLPTNNNDSAKPAIILPHGGPMSRTYGGFDWFSQFFANQGYVVLEPNFRGSSGYGFQFEMEAIQNWGGSMQNDLADAAHWLTQHYNIDKNKICIVGASYGGYAALMAAVKQQDIFKCAASFAGVSDLEYLVNRSKQFTNHKVVEKQIGDNHDELAQKSPVNHAKDINIPVLLIHGDKDRIVDVRHSQRMYKALKDNNKDVEYIELEQGNHYLEIEQNRLETLNKMKVFLDSHLN